jgi:cytochrome c553
MRPWRDRELFWIVKNGIKYTGMPGWAAQQRDDEVWALVAFLRKLPSLDARGYRDLAMGQVQVEPQSGQDVATGDAASAAVGACARCHGAGQNAPPSALVPILHGQPAEFLIAALDDYAGGRRASGMMQPIASDLTPQERERVSRYYAALKPLSPRSEFTREAAAMARGRGIAERGDADAGIPACAGCHSKSALKTYPRLAAQSPLYLANRLRLWKRGLAAITETEVIMAPIARALSEQQIDDVAAYYTSVAPAP